MDDRQTDARRRHVRDSGGEELLFNRALAANLRERRVRAGWTQDQLAGRCGMTRGSIANIERGVQVPGLYRLTVICAALHCELADVLPAEDFAAQTVADTLGDRYASAVEKARRQSLRRAQMQATT